MRLVVCLALAGCDDVWSIDHVDDYKPKQDAASDTVSADAFNPVPDGLIAWYPLDTIDAGTTAIDLANGHDGACQTSLCPVTAEGKVGRAFVFDGNDDVINVEADPILRTTTGFTITLWIRQDAVAGGACPVSKQIAGAQYNNTWQLCVESGKPTFITWDGANAHALAGATPITIGTWFHVAMRYDGTSMNIVVNGLPSSDMVASIVYDDSTLTIGADIDATLVGQWHGAVDDLRIYNRELDLSEIGLIASP